MTFTYDIGANDPDTLNISRVRLELGDTIEGFGVRPDGSNFSDEELALWLEDESDDINKTVWRACASLAKMWTTVASLTVGPRSEQLGQIAKGWADRAAEALPYGASYEMRVVPVDRAHDPYAFRPEDESGL